MGNNPFRHVRSGEPLVIPATTYNAMVDAAQVVRNRRLNLSPHGAGFDSLFVHVVNTTGKALQRFDVVGLDGPLETKELDIFLERIIFKGVAPKKEHKGKFAILQEDAAPDMCVRACVYGTTIAKVKMTSGSASDGTAKLRYCDIEEGQTSYLVSGGHTEVLWSDDSTNDRWSIIRIGSGRSTLFPVRLQKTGGEQGDDKKVATWRYKVTDAMTDEKLEEDVDPVTSPHQWRRPNHGEVRPATFGYAHYDNDDKLVVGWINEVPELPDWSECCVCKPYTLATFTTDEAEPWDLTEYQGDEIAKPKRYWRLTNDYTSYVPISRGCVDENGKLVGLPDSVTPTSYKYTWTFRLEIGCNDGDAIRFPTGTESPSLYNCDFDD